MDDTFDIRGQMIGWFNVLRPEIIVLPERVTSETLTRVITSKLVRGRRRTDIDGSFIGRFTTHFPDCLDAFVLSFVGLVRGIIGAKDSLLLICCLSGQAASPSLVAIIIHIYSGRR